MVVRKKKRTAGTSKERTVSKKKKGIIKVLKERELVYFEPDEWYPAKFIEHEIGDGQYGEYVIMGFEFLGGELENGQPAKGLRLSAIMNNECAPETTLYDFIKVIMGETPDVDEEVDLSAYYDTKVRVFVEDRKLKKGVKDQTRRQSVTKLRHYTKKKKRTAK